MRSSLLPEKKGAVSGFAMNTGHYTQVVWKTSTALGCGVQGRLLVCQYGPGGNMGGEFSSNVQPPTKSESARANGGGAGPSPSSPRRRSPAVLAPALHHPVA